MNDKGLDLLDQKDLILHQAEMQLDKDEITPEQFQVSGFAIFIDVCCLW